jgi:FkbM family methyltransferase
MDFPELKLPIRVFSYIASARIFFSNQYRHPIVHIEPGDIVFDAGCLFGDTSIWFSYQCGQLGHVYSFEFVPEFVEYSLHNFKLNPNYSSNISIHEYALWDESGKRMLFTENGAGSKIMDESKNDCEDNFVSTISIDDFVSQMNIPKVDFIKMDIEGSELKALSGARKTIQAHRPKLAISLYHRDSDFIDIPKLIDSFGVKYKFYLGHYTVQILETVLYAKV